MNTYLYGAFDCMLFAPASSKEFLDIQATAECGFTLKHVREMKIHTKILFATLDKSLSKTLPKQQLINPLQLIINKLYGYV